MIGVLFAYLIQDVQTLHLLAKEDFAQQPCGESLQSNVSQPAEYDLKAGSTLSIIQYIYFKANSTLCSADCQCSGNPQLFGIDPNSTDFVNFNVTNGVYSVQRCPDYQHIFSPEMKDKYIPLFKQTEEEHQCSGACGKLNKYLFSNINK